MPFGCRNNPEKESQKAVDLVTARTLGLAYLEEFKLEDAEKEFLRLIDLAPGEKLGYANLGLTYLRMARYPEAEKQLLKAIKIDPRDPDIRLILAPVFQMKDERERAISELKEALSIAPDHLKILYALTELYAAGTDPASGKEYRDYMLKLVRNAPENLVPRLNLADIYIRAHEADSALEQMEIIRKQFPEFPAEAVDYYNGTISSLYSNKMDSAIFQFTVFNNYIKVTPPYQAGIMELKGPGGSLIGFPLITFDQQSSLQNITQESVLEAIRFNDVTASAGLDIIPEGLGNRITGQAGLTHTEVSDYDGDGDIDIYTGSYDPESRSYRHYLFNNEMGRFTDVSGKAGLGHTDAESSASFADFDNDGFPDLFIIGEKGNILYRNTGNCSFTDITKQAGVQNGSGGNMSLAFDLDHDGDLDIFEARTGPDLLFRNNADGTFQEMAEKMGLSGGDTNSRDAAFGDFDDDGDIDFIVVKADAPDALYSNQRQSLFRDIAAECGLKSKGSSESVTVGDYDNDGFLDLFISSSGSANTGLFRNKDMGRFEPDNRSQDAFKVIKNVRINDAAFFDFDNDGFLDLVLAGTPADKNMRGVFLFHNEGKGKFSDVSHLLPQELKTGRQITLFDYNDDGDIDLLIAGPGYGIKLLRNDGGNSNHFVKMKLVGLRAGSAKNNHFGIGAKVEIRAGDLYQTTVVTDPDVHFGISQRTFTDVIRITWTNGVPQNIFFPETDQSLIEAQTLKGSCPFLYTWDGNSYTFAKDVLWRSGLGMPMGIMGGSAVYAFPDASDDYIKIPGELLKPGNGTYSIQVTSELWETIYLDKVLLVAVDHPGSVDIFVPEQFSPPPFPGFDVYAIKTRITPVKATDSEGNNVLPLIADKDDNYYHGHLADRYQGITEMKDLVIDPGSAGLNDSLCLFMNGWIFPTDASINVALSQTDRIKVAPPVIQVINKKGEWETVISDIGFPMGKDKTVIADLSGKFLSADHRVRIRTNMDIYWDYIFFASRQSGVEMISTPVIPVVADLHYRGFSALYRKGGRYGPHWFDYSRVSTEPKWRDLIGNYTRYGDVLSLLLDSDNKYIISNAGDEVTINFDAAVLPELRKGWKRDFLIKFVGWVKDGDINTALGQTVTPLPFHGMKSYPPGPSDNYPDNPELKEYNRKYNTRAVTRDNYLNALKEKTNTLDKR